MTIVRVKGFQIFRDRHGKWRCYHRKSRISIDLERAPIGSAEFFAECARVGDLLKETLPKPGTFGLLVQAYRASPAFLDLTARTKLNYLDKLDYLAPLADVPLTRFDRPYIVRIRDRAEKRGRAFANYVKAVLSVVLAWGAERGYLGSNPAHGIKGLRRKKDGPDANRPWSDEEREAVLEAVPSHIRPAIALMMFTGLGPKDALTLPRSFVRQGEIATQRSKIGEPVFLQLPERLAGILEATPKHNAITLCANSEGRPWTLSGFRASWRPIRVRLEQQGRIGSGLTLHGLRHTVAVILRESGEDERTIADFLGQRTTEMARHHAKGADLRPKMRGVVKNLDAELHKRRTRAVKPEG